MAERVRARPRELTLHQRLRLEPGERGPMDETWYSRDS